MNWEIAFVPSKESIALLSFSVDKTYKKIKSIKFAVEGLFLYFCTY